MAKLAKPVEGKNSIDNVSEEALVSSSSVFLNGEDDAVTLSKGKGRGRKAKKEVVPEIKVVPDQKAIKALAKNIGSGRGRKKVINEIDDKDKTAVKIAPKVEKKVAPRGRGKKVESPIVEDKPQATVNGNGKIGVAKKPAKRGRKAVVTPKEGGENGADTIVSTATTEKGRGRGKTNAIEVPASPEETAPIQQAIEETNKKRGSASNKTKKEIVIKEVSENGENPEELATETKKKVAKGSKAKSTIVEPGVELEAKKDVKNSRSKAKIPKQEADNETIETSLEKTKGKLSKAKAVTKRKLNNEDTGLDAIANSNEGEVKVKVEEENLEPSPKKKAKTQAKAKKGKAVKSSTEGDKTEKLLNADNLEKTKQFKTSSKLVKSPEIDNTNQLENGVAAKEKKTKGRKRAAPASSAAEDDDVDGAKPAKAKKTSGKLINSTVTKYNAEDFKLQPDENGLERFNLKISSWNVAGLRSWLNKDGLRYLEYELPDIFCLQEIKCTTEQMPDEVARIPGYHPYWLCMPGGYAGVAIYSKIMPINVEYGIGNKEFDAVGRMITAEYEKFFLINVYVPNSGRKLVNLEARMRWEKLFQEYVKRLDETKAVVICGDMNVSHQAIDLANPKTNTRSAGFTQEERDKMTELLGLGFVDTFRHLYPDRTAAYTYWTYMANARSRNVGWRLDYFIVSKRFIKRVVDNCIRSQVMGSDHCPISLFLKM